MNRDILYDLIMVSSLSLGDITLVTDDGKTFRLYKRGQYIIEAGERTLTMLKSGEQYLPSRDEWGLVVGEIGRYLTQNVIAPLGLKLSPREGAGYVHDNLAEAMALFLGLQTISAMAEKAYQHLVGFTVCSENVVNVWAGNLAVSLYIRRAGEKVLFVDLLGFRTAIGLMRERDKKNFLLFLLERLRDTLGVIDERLHFGG